MMTHYLFVGDDNLRDSKARCSLSAPVGDKDDDALPVRWDDNLRVNKARCSISAPVGDKDDDALPVRWG